MKLHSIRIAAMAIIATLGSLTSSAQDFLDNSLPDKLVTVGVRFGINTTSPTNNFKKVYSDINKCFNEWGTGFNTGVVASLNIRNYLALQSGLYFQNKSNDYTIIRANASQGTISTLFSHSRYYYFQVPILAQLRLDVVDNAKVFIDFGPYFAFGLGGNTKFDGVETVVSPTGSYLRKESFEMDYFMTSSNNIVRHRAYDWGFKIGAGVQILEHYSFGIHYNAGCRNYSSRAEMQAAPQVKNREWSFTLGYDF